MVEERELAGICQRIRGSARVPKSQNLSRIEGSTASLSRKYKSAERRRSIADRSGQRCFALPGWSARFGKRRTLCASRCLQNSVRIAKSFWRINAIRRPRAFSIHDFGVVAKSRGGTARRRRTNHSLQAARSEEHTSELQSRQYLVCRLLLEK